MEFGMSVGGGGVYQNDLQKSSYRILGGWSGFQTNNKVSNNLQPACASRVLDKAEYS